MAGKQPTVIEELIRRHFKWLLMCYTPVSAISVSCDASENLSRSILFIHSLLMCAPVTRSFVSSLLRTNVVKAAIDIQIYLLSKSVVSYLKPLVQESINLIFSRLNAVEAVDILLFAMLNSPLYVFKSDENGELWLCVDTKDTCNDSHNIFIDQPTHSDCDDIDVILLCGHKLITELVCRATAVTYILRDLPASQVIDGDTEHIPSALFLCVLERYFAVKNDKEIKLKYATILLVLKSQLEVDMLLGNGACYT